MQDNARELDKIDRTIIYELERNSRMGLTELSNRAHCSKEVAHYRISKLRDRGVIAAFVTEVDVFRLGQVFVGLWIQMGDSTEENKRMFLDYLVSHPKIQYVASCGGKYDISITTALENVYGFLPILNETKKKFPGLVKDYIFSLIHEFRRYSKAHLADGQKELLFEWTPGKRLEIDEKDREIISVLSKDSRASVLEISEKTGISPNTIRTRVRSMERSGLISAYTIFIQGRKAGYRKKDVLISLQNMSDEKEKEILNYCLEKRHVSYMMRIAGRWNLYLSYDSYSDEDFYSFLTEVRSRFSDVIGDFQVLDVREELKADFFSGWMK